MRVRAIALAAGLAAASWVSAQTATDQTAAARADMLEAATAVHAAIVGGPRPLEAMLGTDRAASLAYPLDDPERENWQYWPTRRIGLTVEEMSAAERTETHRLLRAALSTPGYLKVVHIMQLEQILEMIDEGGFPRSVDHYKLVFFGVPSADAPWAWRFEGHHVSLSVAVSPEGVRVTPTFLGSNPAEVETGPLAGFRVHGGVEDLARDLVSSLSPADRGVAVVSDTAPSEIMTATLRRPREQWDAWRESVQPEGIRVSALNELQKHWVRQIVAEVIDNYRPAIAERYHAALDVESLQFAWMGSTEPGKPHYFRLQGGDFLFEYDNVQNDGNHVHSVWRDKSSDFGRDVLGDHYRTSHSR